MNFDKQFEQIGKNREKLLALENEGRYVFHGSMEEIDILEPRQAEKQNNETGEMESDGDLAVFATPHADTAIFRSLINAKDVTGDSSSGFGMGDDGLHFSTTQNLLDAAKMKKGKVYVLDKEQFSEVEGTQCRSFETVTPIDVIEVDFNDLPPSIKLIEE
jgi:hypothetical protein